MTRLAFPLTFAAAISGTVMQAPGTLSESGALFIAGGVVMWLAVVTLLARPWAGR
jgi:hypothetical protein